MRIEVGTSLEVGSVAATANEWLERLNQEGAEVELDVSRIQRLDTAGLQLMLSLLGEIESRNGSFRLRGSSEEFDRVQFRLGLKIPAVQGVG
jgi:ABC-type transporter Mla MlaB component